MIMDLKVRQILSAAYLMLTLPHGNRTETMTNPRCIVHTDCRFLDQHASRSQYFPAMIFHLVLLFSNVRYASEVLFYQKPCFTEVHH